MSKVGQLRLIKEGSTVWSISNQANIVLTKDTIVEVKHNCHGSTTVFVKPQQLLFKMLMPSICTLGTDEWSIDYKNTEYYEIPTSPFY